MTPAKTEGPYFVDEKLNRSDIRESQNGAKLVLTMYVFDADNDCAPVQGAGRSRSRRSTPAGTPAARSTSTSRSARAGSSSRRSCSSPTT
jgi:hypothetical protein